MRSVLLGLLALLSAALFGGCGYAKIRPPGEQVETVTQVSEISYVLKPKTAPATQPWYHELLVELDVRPATPEAMKEALDQRRGPAYQAATTLLQELREEIERKRGKEAKWCLLSLRLGQDRVSRGESVPVAVEMGLTRLYAKRPEIAFVDATLEQCLLRLALQADLKMSSVRTANPVLTWKRQEVSVLEAIDAILNEYGFQRRITGAYARVVLQAEKYATREEFKQAASKVILDYGKGLDRNIPALLVSPAGKPLSKKGEKSAEKPAGEPAPSVPSPPPAEGAGEGAPVAPPK